MDFKPLSAYIVDACRTNGCVFNTRQKKCHLTVHWEADGTKWHKVAMLFEILRLKETKTVEFTAMPGLQVGRGMANFQAHSVHGSSWTFRVFKMLMT
jgi:hypothetical protein